MPPTDFVASPPDVGGIGGRGAKSVDFEEVGSASKALLQANQFQRIVVEIDHVQGYRLDQTAIAHLVEALERVAGKSVSVAGGNSIPRQGGNYYAPDLVELSKGRANSTGDSVASIWVVYLNGRFALDRKTAGVSFAATGIALFPDRLAESGGGSTRAESAILVHELGHLLGLINIGFKSPRAREDPVYPGHSTNEASVMHRTVGAGTRLSAPIDFDQEDLMDLTDLKKGVL